MEEEEFEKIKVLLTDSVRYGYLEFDELFHWYKDSFSYKQKQEILNLVLGYLTGFTDRVLTELDKS